MKSTGDRRLEFSKEQTEAINCIDGQVCIVSVAGSGKTSVIVERADNIIKQGVKPYRILILTFSKAAATHMEERYVESYGSKGIRFSTIHSLCYSVLVRAYGLKPEAILSDRDKLNFFTELHRQLVYKRTDSVPDDFDEFYRKCEEYIAAEALREYYENTLDYIRKHKQSGYDISQYFAKLPDDSCKDADTYVQEKTVDKEYLNMAYEQYKQYKIGNKKLDFDDMVIYCHKCLSRNNKELEYWQSVFDYICVDEFQDTGILQADIIYMVADTKRNICVVGDDDQSIYGFRGVSDTIFKDFMKRFPDSKKIILGTNYRSLSYIIKGADKVIRNNQVRIEKNMKAYRAGDGKIHIREVSTQISQADKVISLINDHIKGGGELGDIAVLYRVKKEASVLVSALETIGMPFFTRDRVDDIHLAMCYKDMLAYYRLSRGIPENGDLVRIINRPKRYLKTNLIRSCEFDRNKIYEACTKNASRHDCLRINDTINDMFLDFRSLSKIDNPTQFIYYIYNNMGYEESLYEYAEYVGMDKEEVMNQTVMLRKEALKFDNMSDWYNYITDREYRQRIKQEEGLYLSTFHGAKGLEWKKVIIISANEYITPYAYMGRVEDYEEERRLFYVAMTRAMDELDILYVAGNSNSRQRSRYIDELMA